ncbi:MAG: class I SAM-dependent methyltransferase [Ilumatobacteraceae bacterium]
MNLDHLPQPADKRIAVRVTRDALRQIRGGSPWLYDGSIESISHEGAPGDLAVVFDHDRKFAAIGLYDPSSPIRVKILHQGAPRPIDADFWRERIAAALDRRSGLADDPRPTPTDSCTARTTGCPGWSSTGTPARSSSSCTRRRGSRTSAPYSMHSPSCSGTIGWSCDWAVRSLPARRSDSPTATSSSARRSTVPSRSSSAASRWKPTWCTVRRPATSSTSATTVHWCGDGPGRRRARRVRLDRGFSLSAAAGGATSVHLVDQSAPALATAERNIAHNRQLGEVRRCAVHTTTGGAFEVLAKLAERDERFDIVIVDPPSFASNQGAVDRALAAYARLTRLALAVTKRGGTLVQASCSSRVTADDFVQTVLDAAASAHREVHLTRRTEHAVDHPIGFEFGAYLKAVYLRVDR